jgi:hypothetical protein
MPNAKSIGWAIYAAGFAIWLFGCLSAGHVPAFDWVGSHALVDFKFRSQPRSRTWTCAHVREHGPDLLAAAAEDRLSWPFKGRIDY